MRSTKNPKGGDALEYKVLMVSNFGRARIKSHPEKTRDFKTQIKSYLKEKILKEYQDMDRNWVSYKTDLERLLGGSVTLEKKEIISSRSQELPASLFSPKANNTIKVELKPKVLEVSSKQKGESSEQLDITTLERLKGLLEKFHITIETAEVKITGAKTASTSCTVIKEIANAKNINPAHLVKAACSENETESSKPLRYIQHLVEKCVQPHLEDLLCKLTKLTNIMAAGPQQKAVLDAIEYSKTARSQPEPSPEQPQLSQQMSSWSKVMTNLGIRGDNFTTSIREEEVAELVKLGFVQDDSRQFLLGFRKLLESVRRHDSKSLVESAQNLATTMNKYESQLS